MENLFLIKLEIFLLFSCFMYIFYYIAEKIYLIYGNVSQIVKPEQISKRKSSLNKFDITKKEQNYKKDKTVSKGLSDKDKQKIIEIIKKVQINSTKGNFELAKNQIIEGLAIDKFHKQLNVELAIIYEKERKFSNAEYIYKDLLEVYESDTEIMKKLAFMYALQNKLSVSLKLYEDIHKKNKGDNDVIDMLCEIAYNMKKYKKTIKYTTLFLKSKPRDVDKMFMKAYALEMVDDMKGSIEIYKRILQLQPYNAKAKESIVELEGKL